MVEILKVEDLPFPLLLGRDTPEFGFLVRAALPEVTAAGEKERLRPSEEDATAEDAKTPPLSPDLCGIDPNFQQEQQADPTVSQVQDDIAILGGQVLDLRWTELYPCLKQVKGVLWRVTGPSNKVGRVYRSLIVIEPYRAQVLQWAHGHHWAGHRG